ncbi:isoleucyl-tRNA synthetase [Cladophialophora yegresii CBS 114405]|uniref:Isoleucyl-tRNA synthetase n=1 Tax=Cladophialophora yegresii CBS 114405 TaxID=1182544 RepID=W9WA39_9EURO|nr:isoleucyl-tRNA synthetase [Cladophialophora yegresii CBS 114405]EXJ64987.1 isoleucyl-tRNA synthetase [Cladophialophora yegresii CBS 114405]
MTEAPSEAGFQIQPDRGISWITLGSSIYSVITRLKASPHIYTGLDLSCSAVEPLTQPIILSLPYNGLRLRFDGPDQRLRLIEVLDFSLSTFVYKNTALVRRAKSSDDVNQDEVSPSGPTFRHVYSRLFGPTYAGEYTAPEAGVSEGTYVLSYPGLAFTFPVKHKAWSEKVDFVSILSSNATGPAKAMAIFSGSSWTEVRSNLYTKPPVYPRSPALIGKSVETVPDEIEEVRVLGGGRLELIRRSSPPLAITLSETTPQDLVADLGPPDAIYRKHDRRISIHAKGKPTNRRQSSVSPGLDPQALDTDQSSMHSYTEDSDFDPELDEDRTDPSSDECFYNYFNHGFDILISFPAARTPRFPGSELGEISASSSAQLVATKILLHGNVPGSFPFNRHRRSRWVIRLDAESREPWLTSEMPFSEVSAALKDVWHDTYKDENEEKQMQRGMVLNRGWGESPESSIELLGDLEESPTREKADEHGLGDAIGVMSNTELFGFPGMLFEVLKNDAVSCLTVF